MPTRRVSRRPRALLFVVVCALPSSTMTSRAGAAAPPDEEGATSPEARAAAIRFFETEVRPLLVESCGKCHGEKRHRGGLRVDGRAALLAGGDSGPAIVPGDPDASLLIRAVRYAEPDLRMPPREKLSDEQIAVLERWVRLGAPFPGAEDQPPVPAGRDKSTVSAEDKEYWAFQPVRPLTPPPSGREGWGRDPIDAWILAGLEERGLEPAPEASPRELIRRVHFDLTGLPPTAEEVERFAADPSDEAWAAVVDELLSRPSFGERQARHWLDVVRYAQTNGYERDAEKPYAWRYRDWVIRSLNDDKPYDRFVAEQLAGDELADAEAESVIGTGFFRLGVWDDEPDDARMAEFDALDDILVATGSAFLGLTLGCARCHDHQFDPIPQRDYYSLLAFFRGLRPYENPRHTLDSATLAPIATAAELEAWRAGHEHRVREAERALESVAGGDLEGRQRLEKELKRVREEQPPFEWALAAREAGPRPPTTHVLIRGSASRPGDEVEPSFPSVLGGGAPEIEPAGERSSGRRRVLAEWLTSPEHPLTARVIVNRVWQRHFGRGIVPTPNDFGRTGLAPTHPEILDELAADLVAGGWRLKRIHRRLLLTDAYRMSSRVRSQEAVEVDPANDSFWRQNLRRLEAEAIRDTVLAVSGSLRREAGGRGFFPRIAPEVLLGGSRPGWGWERSSAEERSRRSVYIFLKRGIVLPLLEGLDFTNTTSPVGARAVTTVAPQALMLLNSEFIEGQARAFAERIVREVGEDREVWVDHAYRLALGRAPSPRERTIAAAYLDSQEAAFAALEPRVEFAPRLPGAMEHGFMRRFEPHDFLSGPASGWSYHRGRWTDAGDSINWVDPRAGPFALWLDSEHLDARVEARLRLRQNSVVGSILARGRAEGDTLVGLELALEAREDRVRLRAHGSAGVRELGDAALELDVDVVYQVRIELDGERVRVWVEEDGAGREGASSTSPLLDVVDAGVPVASGLVGVRAQGAPLELLALALHRVEGGQPPRFEPVPRATPRRRALESLCLVVLNLNELVYVD